MRKRHKMGRRKSKKLFKRTARAVHRKNAHASPMRGGIRL